MPVRIAKSPSSVDGGGAGGSHDFSAASLHGAGGARAPQGFGSAYVGTSLEAGLTMDERRRQRKLLHYVMSFRSRRDVLVARTTLCVTLEAAEDATYLVIPRFVPITPDEKDRLYDMFDLVGRGCAFGLLLDARVATSRPRRG